MVGVRTQQVGVAKHRGRRSLTGIARDLLGNRILGVCVCVCLSVCLSTVILVLQATGQPISDTSVFQNIESVKIKKLIS